MRWRLTIITDRGPVALPETFFARDGDDAEWIARVLYPQETRRGRAWSVNPVAEPVVIEPEVAAALAELVEDADADVWAAWLDLGVAG